MASSLFALLDDIATLLDDISILTKVAAQKTVGVLGDDLALNAQQVAGVASDRELPVVWAVAKGSLLNKAILVPAALAISYWAPRAIVPLLMVGGIYLCFEGVEKLFHKFFHAPREADDRDQLKAAFSNPQIDLVTYEKTKIKGAIKTDFVLSAEIIVIALGTAAGQPLLNQAAVLVSIALVMTVGVYGLVAAIVKLDDAGLWLGQPQRPSLARQLGRALLAIAPLLMKTLSVVGTAAMFLVGGGILVHGFPLLAHLLTHLPGVVHPLITCTVGIVTGILALGLVQLASKLRRKPSHPQP